MALDAETTQALLKKLSEDQQKYNDTLLRVERLLSKNLEATTAVAAAAADEKPAYNSPYAYTGPTTAAKPAARVTAETAGVGTQSSRPGARRNTGTTLATFEVESVKKNSKGSIISSATSGSDSTDEEDGDDAVADGAGTGRKDEGKTLFALKALPTETYDETGLRMHVRDHDWTEAGKAILGDRFLQRDNGKFWRRRAFIEGDIWPSPADEVRDRGKHLPYYSILDVGIDGAPLPILLNRPATSRARDIWDRIRSVNADPKRERKAVGRITVVHEPSPLLFAALHYTMSPHFDVDELFQLLVDTKTEALPHRPFSLDTKHRKTFVWTMEYFTIVGEDCQPMPWQRADENLAEAEQHIPVSRCSSVIALSLVSDTPMSQIRNKARRQERKYGDVYDPFAPWHVLNIQAYPDWRSSINAHSPSKNYVNGPEAFLVMLRTEFKDAQKRLREVYKRISELVATPPSFMFQQSVRDKLLFEDDEFTYSRRYFWAYQSLAIMNEDIQEMISAYRTTFTEGVWDGSDKIIWPGDEAAPARYRYWRKRMTMVRQDIEREIRGLELIDRLNDEKMKEIKSLRDNLFSGTSVLESRRSVQQQAITVQQGHNIKVLTLVTIFFLPLTFVTSVFGMTNMNPNDTFVPFGIVTACICFPTYLLILSLNTSKGLQFWTQKPIAIMNRIGGYMTMTAAVSSTASSTVPVSSDAKAQASRSETLSSSQPQSSLTTLAAMGTKGKSPTLHVYSHSHSQSRSSGDGSAKRLPPRPTLRSYSTSENPAILEGLEGSDLTMANTIPMTIANPEAMLTIQEQDPDRGQDSIIGFDQLTKIEPSTSCRPPLKTSAVKGTEGNLNHGTLPVNGNAVATSAITAGTAATTTNTAKNKADDRSAAQPPYAADEINSVGSAGGDGSTGSGRDKGEGKNWFLDRVSISGRRRRRKRQEMMREKADVDPYNDGTGIGTPRGFSQDAEHQARIEV